MKNIGIFVILIFLFNLSYSQSSKSKLFNLIVGTFTSSGKSEGIYVYDFNCETGEFNYKSKAIGIENPSYLAISSDRKYVYSINDVKEGGVSSFNFNSVTGELTFLNRASSGGSGPCYISTDNDGKYVFIGNYTSGSVCVIPIKEDGSLDTYTQLIQLEGSSIDKFRQEKPHIHSTVLSPDNRYLFTPDLGTDKVNIYRFDPTRPSQPLSPAEQPFAVVKPGSGPRHMTFHPDSKHAYVIQEMDGSITVFDYKNGKLRYKQLISMLSPGFNGKVYAADVHVSPDGNFLYGSNRGNANEIVIFSVKKNGELIYAGRQSTLVKTPRNFAIDPTGNFLLVANQSTDEIVFFKRDKKTGLLTPTGKKIHVGAPVCLKFVPVY